jgi:hypothetical protein
MDEFSLLKGGSWISIAKYTRSASWDKDRRDNCFNNLGFRLLLVKVK